MAPRLAKKRGVLPSAEEVTTVPEKKEEGFEPGELEELEEWSEDREEREAEELGRAFLDEWDVMALDRARDAAEAGFGHTWEGGGEEARLERREGGDPLLLPRLWESSFYFTAFQNIETKPQYFFYVVTFEHINKNRRVTGPLRRRVLYTPGFHLRGGAYKALHAPLPIWPKKSLPVSYGDLPNYAVTIDLWMISEYTFNTLYASTTFSLRDAVDSEQDVALLLQRRLPTKKRSYEVQRLKISFHIAEVFDFDLFLESWSYTPARHIGPGVASVQKYLKFLVPKGAGLGWKAKKTDVSLSAFWPAPFNFVYRGTVQQLQNSYFIVKVYMKAERGWFQRDPLIGTCIMSLRSVTTYPVFRGMVKQLTIDELMFNQGDLSGNIRCYMRSAGLPYYEDPAIVKRPEQPLAGAAMVTQLDYREQFLVVRLLKCENLPAANIDSGTSDPIVKVKWDGMINTSTVKPNTLRPVWNQNLYFPIRLLDPSERTVPLYIQKCLPLDLLSKGNIVFECWDQDETSSDYLGGTELHLSELINKGVKMTRCLAEGLAEGGPEGARLPDGRPAAFVYEGAEGGPPPEPTEMTPAVVQPYEVKHLTPVYSGQAVELTGSTIPSALTAKPCIFFEVFCIPPLPPELAIPAPLPVKEEQDLWKQWTRRWERDYNRWLRIYNEWFPTAPRLRRFLCTVEHPQTRRLHPLPAFLTPVAIPEQIAGEGELLHWISNMTFLISQKQRRTGLLPRWLSPNYFLMARKGGVNDHAVLLCSCLLGLEYDAYVCKGTIENETLEHCWVMTRHEDGWVIFWEATTKKRYHLPQRWRLPPTTSIMAPVGGPKVDFAAAENPYYTDSYLQACFGQAAAQTGVSWEPETLEEGTFLDLYGEEVVADVRVDEARLELEIWDKGREQRAKPEPRKKRIDRDRIREWMRDQIDLIPIAPKKHLLDPMSTLAYVPYSSIEVIFNHEQLWGNMQNHHPAVIAYDLEDPYLWRPFLTEKPTSIDSLIFIAPSTRDKSCEVLAAEIRADVAENIRVFRSRRGLETALDHTVEKTERIEKYLDLLEFRMRLDPEFDPGPPLGHEGWSAWGTYESADQTKDYDTTWYTHLQRDPESMVIDPNVYAPEEDAAKALQQEEPVPDVTPLQTALPEAAYGPRTLARPTTSTRAETPTPPEFVTAAQHGASREDVQFNVYAERRRSSATPSTAAAERSDSFRTALESENGQHSFESAVAGTPVHSRSLFSPALFGKPSPEASEVGLEEDAFGSSSEEEEADADDTRQILEFCKRHNVRLATALTCKSLSPSVVKPTPTRQRPADQQPLYIAEGQGGPGVGPPSFESSVSREEPGTDFLVNLPSVGEVDPPARQRERPPQPKDEYWEAFEQVYNEAGVYFQLNPQHGMMMMEDYEEFESRLGARRPPPGAAPTPPPAPAPPPPRPDEAYYKLIQKPPKGREETGVVLEGVDITKLGFAIEEHPAGAVVPPEEIVQPPPEEAKPEAPAEEKRPEPTAPAETQPPLIFRRPIPASRAAIEQQSKWGYYYRMEALYYQWQRLRFPVRSSHTFCGFPVHLSTTDASDIRTFLLASRRFRKVMEINVDGITYVVRCKVYPLMGGVVSVWLFIGCEIHWAGKEQRQTRMRRRKPRARGKRSKT